MGCIMYNVRERERERCDMAYRGNTTISPSVKCGSIEDYCSFIHFDGITSHVPALYTIKEKTILLGVGGVFHIKVTLLRKSILPTKANVTLYYVRSPPV